MSLAGLVCFAGGMRLGAQPTYTISTYAGNGTRGFTEGGATSGAQFALPSGIAFDSSGNLVVADQVNQRVRQIATGGGNVTTIAGNGTAGFSGGGKSATAADLFHPFRGAGDSRCGRDIAGARTQRVRHVVG